MNIHDLLDDPEFSKATQMLADFAGYKIGSHLTLLQADLIKLIYDHRLKNKVE